jgi:predicted porin
VGLAPSGLSQSNIGVQIKEPLGQGWSFVGQLEAGFDPYSLRLASSPGSEWNNRGVPLDLQTTNGDWSRAANSTTRLVSRASATPPGAR